MAIGEVLREARVQLGITQEYAGEVAYLSSKTISAVECGRRQLDHEALGRLVISFDHPRLAMEAAAEVTGGMYCSPWLDGEGVDLHRASVWAKTIEELQEAARSVEMVNLINLPRRSDDGERHRVRESMMQLLDARVAVDHYIAIVCSEYGLSVSLIYQEHREKLESRGYLKPRQKEKGRQRRR